jgi:hypothetical protein
MTLDYRWQNLYTGNIPMKEAHRVWTVLPGSLLVCCAVSTNVDRWRMRQYDASVIQATNMQLALTGSSSRHIAEDEYW